MNPHDLIKIASFLATIGVVSNLGRVHINYSGW